MEITCPHCQSRHAADAVACPVCGPPVASPTGPAAPMPQGVLSTVPAARAEATAPVTNAAVTPRPRAPALIAPWRLVLLGITLPLLLAPAAVYAMQRLAPRVFPSAPVVLPTATSAPPLWTPGGLTPAAMPAPTATRTIHLVTPTAGGAPGRTSPTATLPPATATPTAAPPTATVLPTETSTPYNQG